jgi:predicted enzyme related to lactoylglutathione lyase
MSIKIKEVAFVFHSITDVGRARGFYEKLLGLKTGHQIEFAPGMWWIEYDVAGTAVALCNAMPGPPASALALEVEDLDGALVAFKAAGVPLSQEVMEFAPCRMFAVKDPDGNEIRFHKLKAKS